MEDRPYDQHSVDRPNDPRRDSDSNQTTAAGGCAVNETYNDHRAAAHARSFEIEKGRVRDALKATSFNSRVTLENVDRAMTYQPATFDQVDRFEQVREGCIALAKVVLRIVPDCADRSEALRELRNVRMWANSAIALRGEF